MNQIALDSAARSVTVEAGVTYGQLCPHLDSKGFALHSLASLPHISVAGACSATHGSGQENGNVATAVSAVALVNANGDVVKISRIGDKENFAGAVVGLGAVGVITRVTLNVQPTYQVKQYVYEDLPMSELEKNFDAIQSSAYSVSLFTDRQERHVNEVWLKVRTDKPDAFNGPAEFFDAKRATRNLHPIATHSKMGFTPSAGKELQSEYLVPREIAV